MKKNKKPIVSVIMSVYNPNDYKSLLTSVQSILNQSLKNFEFIICDDGSSNKKVNGYLKKIGQLDSRIKIIGYKINRGLAYSRNQCIKISEGKYIAFQDDDDISNTERLKKEVLFLDHHPEYSFVGTNANVFNKKGVWGEYKSPETPTKKDFLWNSPFLNPSMMFRTSILKEMNGFRVAPETRRAEDYDLFFRLYSKGYKGYNIQQKLFNYRIEIEKEKNNKYRPMRDRIQEAKVRYKGFKKLNMRFIGIPFILKPIIIGLIPERIFYIIRKSRY